MAQNKTTNRNLIGWIVLAVIFVCIALVLLELAGNVLAEVGA